MSQAAARGRGTDRSDLEWALLERLRHPFDLGRVRDARIVLGLTDGDPWTLYVRDGQLALGHGADPAPDTTIVTDIATMTGLIEGTESGVRSFLDGRLRVRGNLALSLRLSAAAPAARSGDSLPRARDLRVGKLDTFVLEAGNGPPVVLLHGLGATNSSLLPTLQDLSRDHHVIAPDLPGFGDSSKPIRSYDAAFYAKWVTELLDELGIERAHVVGNSLGGRIAVEAALRSPDRVDRLALYAPSSAFIRRREWTRLVRFLRPEMALLPVPLAHKHVVASIRAMFSRPSRLPDSWYAAAADEFLRVFAAPRGRIAFFSAARQIYLEEPYGETGFWDRLRDLKTPALFIWGENDRLVPARFARHVEKAVRGVESIVLEDCGHVPQFEHPDRAHGLTREFLAG